MALTITAETKDQAVEIIAKLTGLTPSPENVIQSMIPGEWFMRIEDSK